MILDLVPPELLILINFYCENKNFRLSNPYVKRIITKELSEISSAYRPHDNIDSVHGIIKKFSNTFNRKWPSKIKNKAYYLRKLYIVQLYSRNIDQSLIILFTNYLRIQIVKQLLPILFKNNIEIIDRCSKISTLLDAKNALTHIYTLDLNDSTNDANMKLSYIYEAIMCTDVITLENTSIDIAHAICNICKRINNISYELEILNVSIKIAVEALTILKRPGYKFLYLYE